MSNATAPRRILVITIVFFVVAGQLRWSSATLRRSARSQFPPPPVGQSSRHRQSPRSDSQQYESRIWRGYQQPDVRNAYSAEQMKFGPMYALSEEAQPKRRQELKSHRNYEQELLFQPSNQGGQTLAMNYNPFKGMVSNDYYSAEQPDDCNHLDGDQEGCPSLGTANASDEEDVSATVTGTAFDGPTKRANSNRVNVSACDCRKRTGRKSGLIDLGPDHYPQLLPNVTCESAHCDGQASRCRPKYYKVHVLKRISHPAVDRDPQASPVPPELASCWRFELVNVVTDCQCVR